jgi:hypothetical protein
MRGLISTVVKKRFYVSHGFSKDKLQYKYGVYTVQRDIHRKR